MAESPEQLDLDNLFLSCDWGTSSFRLKLAERDGHRIHETLAKNYGIKRAYSDWRKRQQDISRQNFYLNYLKRNISELEEQVGIELYSIPILISGMASSNLGFKELPYASLPLALDSSQLQIDITEPTRNFPRKLILVSGVSSDHDIMRGEESQLFGLDVLYDIGSCICIFPGTHSKHIFIENRELTDFKTYMTGEIFELLSEESVLETSVSMHRNLLNTGAFQRGIKNSIEHNLLRSLFQIRADHILHQTDKRENAELLSGLFIGEELTSLRHIEKGQKIIMAGEKPLQKWYIRGLKYLDLDQNLTVISDWEASALTVEGHRNILNQM